MNRSFILGYLLLCNISIFQPCSAKPSINSIKSYFFKKPYEQIVQKEFDLGQDGTLHIKNDCGSITVKGWKHNSVQLKATKQVYQEKYFDNVWVASQQSDKFITIETKQKNPKDKETINFELLVPNTTKIVIKNGNGSISVKNIDSPLQVATLNGNIILQKAGNSVLATTEYGDISLDAIAGNIQSTVTKKGNIYIAGATTTIAAKTDSGTIYTACKGISSLDSIMLSTKSGNVELQLPEHVNADLQAQTKKGKLFSEHFITLKPQTVQLNKKTWNQLKKQVHGTLGTGEAIIKINSDSGNIKISKANTAPNKKKAA